MSLILNISLSKYAKKMQEEGIDVTDNSQVSKKIYEILDKHYGVDKE